MRKRNNATGLRKSLSTRNTRREPLQLLSNLNYPRDWRLSPRARAFFHPRVSLHRKREASKRSRIYISRRRAAGFDLSGREIRAPSAEEYYCVRQGSSGCARGRVCKRELLLVHNSCDISGISIAISRCARPRSRGASPEMRGWGGLVTGGLVGAFVFSTDLQFYCGKEAFACLIFPCW